MVTRAAYAVSRGFVAPGRILLLAFNKAAATELQERVAARFAAAGIDSSGVRASTFHSFGLDVIGRATGEKPRLARWLDQGDDEAMVLRIADELRDASGSFRYQWDLYRLLFANAPADLAENEPDGYNQATRQAGYRTFAGEVVIRQELTARWPDAHRDKLERSLRLVAGLSAAKTRATRPRGNLRRDKGPLSRLGHSHFVPSVDSSGPDRGFSARVRSRGRAAPRMGRAHAQHPLLARLMPRDPTNSPAEEPQPIARDIAAFLATFGR